MEHIGSIPSPIIVGGLGGSGTRVVAQILMGMGIYLGSDQNISNDNLWFTVLFKRPEWFKREILNSPAKATKAIKAFEKIMTGRRKLNFSELSFVLKAAGDYARTGTAFKPENGWTWTMERLQRMFSGEKYDPRKHIGWGWKEPNAHVFLKYFCEYFPEMKFVQVVRHPLDMAYSKNQAQLHNWSWLYDLEQPKSPELQPKATLSYWLKANQVCVETGKKQLGSRFLLLNFDQLCTSPSEEIVNLAKFLEVNLNASEVSKLASLPKLPESVGRYKTRDLSIFSKAELDAVRNYGFEVAI